MQQKLMIFSVINWHLNCKGPQTNMLQNVGSIEELTSKKYIEWMRDTEWKQDRIIGYGGNLGRWPRYVNFTEVVIKRSVIPGLPHTSIDCLKANNAEYCNGDTPREQFQTLIGPKVTLVKFICPKSSGWLGVSPSVLWFSPIETISSKYRSWMLSKA